MDWKRIAWVATVVAGMVLVAIFADEETVRLVVPILGGLGTAGPGLSRKAPALPLLLLACLPAFGCGSAYAADTGTVRTQERERRAQMALVAIGMGESVIRRHSAAVLDLVEDEHRRAVARALASAGPVLESSRDALQAYLAGDRGEWLDAAACAADAITGVLRALRHSGTTRRLSESLQDVLGLLDLGAAAVPGGCPA